MLQQGESDQNHLTLFLEDDNEIAGLLRRYLRTGDLNPMVEFLLPGTSIERLEDYCDLRVITGRIDSMNRVLPRSKQIVFDIQGPEAFNAFNPTFLDSSESAAKRWYVNQRDSLTAINVVSYLKARPEMKALMFFSNSHFIKSTTEKKFTESLPPGQRAGHWLGYYLRREFGDDQMFTISQIDRQHSPLQPGKYDGPDIMFLARDVPWADSEQTNHDVVSANFDAFVVRNQFNVPTHPLAHVFSTRVISASILKLEFLQDHRSGALGNRFYERALRALEFLSDTSFQTPAQWKSWNDANRFQGPDWFQSEKVRSRLANHGSRALGTPDLGTVVNNLIELGFDPRVGSPAMTPQEWDKDFNDMWPQMVILNTIGVYWIGTPEEQSRARAYLVQSSGKNFDDPALYLKWWRQKFYHVAY